MPPVRIEFEKSTRKNKKYLAGVYDARGELIRKSHFGDSRYQHYRDSTPVKLFSHLDHGGLVAERFIPKTPHGARLPLGFGYPLAFEICELHFPFPPGTVIDLHISFFEIMF
jgi:hypothetical protein